MTAYTKSTNFLTKDTLPDGDTGKIIKGSEFDTEFNNLQTAVNSKANSIGATLSGTPTAPTAGFGTNTTQIATTAFVQTAATAAFPSGGIIIWSGSALAIPAGWLLCDGTSSTPNLQDRFVVGAGSTYNVNDTGGSADAVVVSHTHGAGTLVTAAAGSHNHYLSKGAAGQGGGGDANQALVNPYSDNDFLTSTVAAHTHTISGSTAEYGEDGTNKNLPPYYALCYIMKA